MNGGGEPERRVPRLLQRWLQLPRLMRAMAPIALMAWLWRASSQPPAGEQVTALRAFLHNGMHVGAYALLAAVIWLAWSRSPIGRAQRGRSFGSWLLATAYGAVDELHQSFVPGRVCSLADLASDAVGAALAVISLRMWFGLRPFALLPLALWAAAGIATAALATWGP